MRRTAFSFAWVAALATGLMLAAGMMLAQGGHPLVGSWHGNWGPNAKDRIDVTFVMNYDGKNISVLLNPGFDSVKMQKADLDPSNWTVHFEGDSKDSSGKPVHLVIDGKFQDLTSDRRSLVGTWMQGAMKGDFKVTRDN